MGTADGPLDFDLSGPGHRDMNVTSRYIQPQEQTIRDVMGDARSCEWA
jgi:hypothetical protein